MPPKLQIKSGVKIPRARRTKLQLAEDLKNGASPEPEHSSDEEMEGHPNSEDDTTDGLDLPHDDLNISNTSRAKKATAEKSKGKHKRSKKDSLTAEERALDSSSDEDDKPTQSTSTQRAAGSRAPISRRALDPLPSIDPSVVRGKELKHPVATAMQIGNEAKLQMLRSAQQADLEARDRDLNWQKERYFLEREDEAKRHALNLQND
ncbi:uncharacterized protein MELLADRAFT_114158 [Melampsora larici-populina 98AG31]|uniref:Uncharacterized protein n=1 Tax=Melampsora larici-populina (strain 98AG31 / pathotype 3-4-7) TaxID=747676 RepID=F4SCF6_MELLP|nr:uncharacterized protein MELLADRAFT_114158 [Melampsora larici-populina 98AG31]EGF97665.1 hypothetical protein MELLADRAFT_114158 [Melampsora larici-populina 98AG31]